MVALTWSTACAPASREIMPLKSICQSDIEDCLPDAHLQIVDTQDRLQACCSLWWQHTPAYTNEALGLIGHYAANTELLATELLTEALQMLREHGCSIAIGPLDGSTWKSYRFVTRPGSEPPFFLEPSHPASWPAHFQAQGFTTLARYYSAKIGNITQRSENVQRRQQQFLNQGIAIRSFRPAQAHDDLRGIYQLSRQSFQSNFLQTPISEDAFLRHYQALLPHIVPELTLLAEQEGRVLGYIFCIPDYLQLQRGQIIDTIVIKTVAIQLKRAYAGLGSVLVEAVQHQAYELGYRQAIYALMHEQNQSLQVGHRYAANIIREYSLFQRRLV